MLEIDILPGYDGASEEKLRIAANKSGKIKNLVIPAQARIHLRPDSANVNAASRMRKVNMDPSLRWDDGYFCRTSFGSAAFTAHVVRFDNGPRCDIVFCAPPKHGVAQT